MLFDAFSFNAALCKMFVQNTRLTHLSLMRRTLNSTIDCIVSKLKSLVHFGIESEY